MRMTPTLNPYQSEQLHEFMAEHAADECIAADCGEKPHQVIRLEWFPCSIIGMVAVKGEYDDTMKLLYPTPRPVPRDPLFQHADSISILDARKFILMLKVQPYFYRDWQTENFMDAPDHGPGGSCRYSSVSDEAYGAVQTTFDREWWI